LRIFSLGEVAWGSPFALAPKKGVFAINSAEIQCVSLKKVPQRSLLWTTSGRNAGIKSLAYI